MRISLLSVVLFEVVTPAAAVANVVATSPSVIVVVI